MNHVPNRRATNFFNSLLEAELVGRDNRPDHIFLADTTGDEMWYFFQPVADGRFSIDMAYIDVVPPIDGATTEES